MTTDKSDAAHAMRELPLAIRNELIASADNCIDARKRFDNARLARQYRSPNEPKGVA